MSIESRISTAIDTMNSVTITSTDSELSMYKSGLRDKGHVIDRKLMYLSIYRFASNSIDNALSNSLTLDDLSIKESSVNAMLGNTKEVLFSLTKQIYEI